MKTKEGKRRKITNENEPPTKLRKTEHDGSADDVDLALQELALFHTDCFHGQANTGALEEEQVPLTYQPARQTAWDYNAERSSSPTVAAIPPTGPFHRKEIVYVMGDGGLVQITPSSYVAQLTEEHLDHNNHVREFIIRGSMAGTHLQLYFGTRLRKYVLAEGLLYSSGLPSSDNDVVTMEFPSLPRSPCVDAIFKYWCHRVRSTWSYIDYTYLSILLAPRLREIFQESFRQCPLLYSGEVVMVDSVSGPDLLTVLGAEHLLRFLIVLPSLLSSWIFERRTPINMTKARGLLQALVDILKMNPAWLPMAWTPQIPGE